MTDPGRIGHGVARLPDHVDVVVIGLGITGAGVALDATTRGLETLAVDANDLAFGTSRWSSKLVHGGLRYLAKGQFGVAHESAVERGILMEVTAPHLTHAMPMLIPLIPGMSTASTVLTRAGLVAGDLLRRSAGTSPETLPRPRRISATEALRLAPGLRPEGLRGGLLTWDGQLEDDARLVANVARTAAAYGAEIRTRARVLTATGTRVELRDELTGQLRTITAGTVINATGVWAGDLVDEITLRPSRGTHLVLRAETYPDLRATVTAPVPGSTSRFVMLLPQPDGTIYVGLTDEPIEGPIPDVPTPSETEIGFLLDVVSGAFSRPLRRSDVVGAFAGLRPLIDTGDGDSADLSRKHAVLTSRTGVITVVGGKLTTYRRMAQDAVDAAVARAALTVGPCVTASTPLLGAASRSDLARLDQPARLVRRFGTDAALVLDTAREVTGLSSDDLLEPVSDTIAATLAELVFGVTHEGAVDVDDLLDRRTRVGLIPTDRTVALPVARRALDLAIRGVSH